MYENILETWIQTLYLIAKVYEFKLQSPNSSIFSLGSLVYIYMIILYCLRACQMRTSYCVCFLYAKISCMDVSCSILYTLWSYYNNRNNTMGLDIIIFANSQTTSCLQNEEEWIVVLTTKTCRRSFLLTAKQNVKRSKLFITKLWCVAMLSSFPL